MIADNFEVIYWERERERNRGRRANVMLIEE